MVTVKFYNYSSNPDPCYKHDGDAGFDLYSNESLFIEGQETSCVDVGLRVDIPPGYEGQIRLRSSYAKKGIIIPNAPGTIDSGYRGHILVPIRNMKPHESIKIDKGERFAQMIINKLPDVELVAVDKEELFLEETSRGEGGFGSTGSF